MGCCDGFGNLFGWFDLVEFGFDFFDDGFAEGGVEVLDEGGLAVEDLVGPDGVGDDNGERGVFEVLGCETVGGVFREDFCFVFGKFGTDGCGGDEFGHAMTGYGFCENVLEGGEHGCVSFMSASGCDYIPRGFLAPFFPRSSF